MKSVLYALLFYIYSLFTNNILQGQLKLFFEVGFRIVINVLWVYCLL